MDMEYFERWPFEAVGSDHCHTTVTPISLSTIQTAMSTFKFNKDHSWPAGLFKIFERGTPVGQRNRYFGAYHSLLSWLSSPLYIYVAPQKPPWKRMNDKVNLVNFIVYNSRGTVLFVDVKDECQADYVELCELADAEMRCR
jgi:hypothetical protein